MGFLHKPGRVGSNLLSTQPGMRIGAVCFRMYGRGRWTFYIRHFIMEELFNDRMSSAEAKRVLWEYAYAHRGEDIEEVKAQYREVAKRIIAREQKENERYMT